jgi:hypothetical protein
MQELVTKGVFLQCTLYDLTSLTENKNKPQEMFLKYIFHQSACGLQPHYYLVVSLL